MGRSELEVRCARRKASEHETAVELDVIGLQTAADVWEIAADVLYVAAPGVLEMAAADVLEMAAADV